MVGGGNYKCEKNYRVSFGNGVNKAFLVIFFAKINKTSRFNCFLDYALRRFRWRINKETFLSCSNIFPILAKLKVIQKQGKGLKNLCNYRSKKTILEQSSQKFGIITLSGTSPVSKSKFNLYEALSLTACQPCCTG